MAKPIHRREYEVVRNLLREWRINAGVKQVDLSTALGKPQPYISAIETGHRRVDLVEVRDICRVLGVTLPDFIVALEESLRSPSKTGRVGRTRVD